MSKTRMIRLLGAALLLGLAILSSPSDAGKRSDSEVKIEVESGKADSSGKQTITLKVNINKGWYIYANPVENKDFESNQTVVRVFADKKELDAKIEYPRGTPKSTGDIKYAVYQGTVPIRVHINRPADAKNVELTVRLNTCNVEGLCLLPATVKLSVP